MNLKINFILSLIILTLFGCVSVQSDWEKTKDLNSKIAYNEFLKKHPDSEFSSLAEKNLYKIEWQEAKKIDTILFYQRFIKKYPQSEYKAEAIKHIHLKEWEGTKGTNTIESYQNFIKKYPQSNFFSEAKSNIQKLELEDIRLNWHTTKIKNTIASYKTFIKAHPQSEFTPQAKLILAEKLNEKEKEKSAWVKAKSENTIFAYRKFAALYPKSKYIDKTDQFEKELVNKTIGKTIGVVNSTLKTKAGVKRKLKSYTLKLDRGIIKAGKISIGLSQNYGETAMFHPEFNEKPRIEINDIPHLDYSGYRRNITVTDVIPPDFLIIEGFFVDAFIEDMGSASVSYDNFPMFSKGAVWNVKVPIPFGYIDKNKKIKKMVPPGKYTIKEFGVIEP